MKSGRMQQTEWCLIISNLTSCKKANSQLVLVGEYNVLHQVLNFRPSLLLFKNGAQHFTAFFSLRSYLKSCVTTVCIVLALIDFSVGYPL